MGPHVGGVGDTHVEIADFAGRAVFILEVATGHNASEGVGDAVLNLPVEHLGVKRGLRSPELGKSTKTRTLGWVTVSPD